MDLVIDTNVLVTALKSSRGTSYKLLSIIDDNRLQLHVTTPLVVEYEAILKREIVTMTSRDIEAVVDYLCLVASKHEIFYLWRPLLKDACDDHVLELAVKAEAMIVTWNLRDFHAASTLGIEAVTPRELLKRMEEPS